MAVYKITAEGVYYSKTSKETELLKSMLGNFIYGAFCGFEGIEGMAGVALRYSRTKTCKILLRF